MKEYDEKSDQVLVELTLLGNEQAFAELVTRHERAVKGTAYKVTQNPWSAEDAAQDAFVSAWMRLDALNDRSRFGPWVCAIAKNCARDLVIHYRNTVPDIGLQIPDEGDLPDAAFAKEEEKRELHDAVGTLTEKIRDVVRLHYFEGYSVDEIAAKLSLPAGTVKWRLSEGRKQLRKGYGIVEKEYKENEALLARVMRQVEELKLWRLKNDRTGFEEDYRRVLSSVETLDEGKEKLHALADVWIMGYWWLPGKKNDDLLEKIKQAALESHNEDVMEAVVWEKIGGGEKEDIAYIRDVAVPFLEKHGFVKALGYAWFWYGVAWLNQKDGEKALAAFRRATGTLDPSCVYHAAALAAIRATEQVFRALENGSKMLHWNVTGEDIRRIGNKTYLWAQPGYNRNIFIQTCAGLFWNAAACDNLIWDPGAKPGDTVASSDGQMVWTLLETDRTVRTPAGAFTGCAITKVSGEHHGLTEVETAFCPGVGIVWQRAVRFEVENEWYLARWSVTGGEGMLPFAPGNVWEYTTDTLPKEMIFREVSHRFEVVSSENGKANLSGVMVVDCAGFVDTWAGKMRELQARYCTSPLGEDEELQDVDVEALLIRLSELAATKREKVETAIATEVMRRIFDTEPARNPKFTERGKWNFFDVATPKKENGKVWFVDEDVHFEWKTMGKTPWAECQVLFGDLFTILQDAAGAAWSDEWTPGYLLEEDARMYGKAFKRSVRVLDDETVETPAGVFRNCRHVCINAANYPACGTYYRSGKMEAWYAPGVGLVQYSRPMDGVPENVWQLTAYKGTGEGCFPIADGFFRRYEPRKIAEGWRASVEYTFDEDESGIVCFRNTLGVQDRAHYEAFLKKKKEEDAKKN